MARKISLKELRRIIEAEMKNQQDTKDVKVQQRPWWDADGALENEVDWLKALNIREFFSKKVKKNG